jgi:hypothetical protein
MHTYIHAYMHTCIHAYNLMHTYAYSVEFLSEDDGKQVWQVHIE